MYDQKRRQYKTVTVYIFNRYNLFVIVWLKLFISAISIYIYYYYIAIDNPHYKVYFIEIVKVIFLDRIFYMYIGHQLEPCVRHNRIFIEGSLKVVYARKTRFEFGTMFNKVVKPSFIYRCRTTRRTKKIGYASYYIEPRRKSSRI